MTESIVSVVQHVVVVVDIIKPARTEIQRRRHVGIETTQSHASWLLGEGLLTFNHFTYKLML